MALASDLELRMVLLLAFISAKARGDWGWSRLDSWLELKVARLSRKGLLAEMEVGCVFLSLAELACRADIP